MRAATGANAFRPMVKAAMAALPRRRPRCSKNREWVGASVRRSRARDARRARSDPAPIHGQATLAEAKALAEEGVPVAPLPLPVVPPDALQLTGD